eukprot:9492081-Pyramimonas_sp.AAC.1
MPWRRRRLAGGVPRRSGRFAVVGGPCEVQDCRGDDDPQGFRAWRLCDDSQLLALEKSDLHGGVLRVRR